MPVPGLHPYLHSSLGPGALPSWSPRARAAAAALPSGPELAARTAAEGPSGASGSGAEGRRGGAGRGRGRGVPWPQQPCARGHCEWAPGACPSLRERAPLNSLRQRSQCVWGTGWGAREFFWVSFDGTPFRPQPPRRAGGASPTPSTALLCRGSHLPQGQAALCKCQAPGPPAALVPLTPQPNRRLPGSNTPCRLHGASVSFGPGAGGLLCLPGVSYRIFAFLTPTRILISRSPLFSSVGEVPLLRGCLVRKGASFIQRVVHSYWQVWGCMP